MTLGVRPPDVPGEPGEEVAHSGMVTVVSIIPNEGLVALQFVGHHLRGASSNAQHFSYCTTFKCGFFRYIVEIFLMFPTQENHQIFSL